jgi:co-chaperonin GroES (HSP10)
MKPLRDKLFVRPEKRIKSELYVQSAEVDTVGIVVAVGDEAHTEGLNIGDKVYFGTLAKDYKDEYLKYTEFKDNGERLIVMSWQDVCFVEEQE